MTRDKILFMVGKIKRFLHTCGEWVKHLFSSWPKVFIGISVAAIIGLYPLSAIINEEIDRTADYDFSDVSESQSQGLQAAVFLIDREINKHLWTANLPFFFPAYVLDNMPAFQTGIIKALAPVIKTWGEQVQCPDDEKKQKYLSKAGELLGYPVDVWLLDNTNKLKIAPSSAAQYRKARKKIKDFNQALHEEKCFWVRDGKTLSALNETIIVGLEKVAKYVENEIREGSTGWFETQSDDVFYHNQGRVYAYMIMMKKLGRDYKQLLMSDGIYQEWTTAIRALQTATEINPIMVLNGDIKAGIKANHLVALGYYVLKAQNMLVKINQKLNGDTRNDN